MDKWIVIPLQSVGKIKFGMRREEVRSIINKNYTEYKKNRYSQNTTDDFGFCQIFYDKKNLCEAVEIFEEVEVSMNGITLFPGSVDTAYQIIPGLVQDEYGLTSTIQSIGISVLEGKIESILFGRQGYYL